MGGTLSLQAGENTHKMEDMERFTLFLDELAPFN